MNFQEIKDKCLRGYMAIIPGWEGYIKYNYGNNEIYFQNKDYILPEKELKAKIKDRTDLYYII